MSIKTFHYLLDKMAPNIFFRIRGINKIPSINRIYDTNKIFFIQIGANDGLLHDPLNFLINKYHWKGILVEPVKQYYHKLRETYAKEQDLIFENCAISDRNSKKTIYKIKDNQKYIAKWLYGIASLDKKILLSSKFAFPEIEKFIEKEIVKCITLQKLIDKNNVKKIDILCIDVEGHDAVIINQIPDLSIKPKVIYYENKHLESKESTNCQTILRDLGYHLSKGLFGKNVLAFLK